MVLYFFANFSETGSFDNENVKVNRVVDELTPTEIVGLLSLDPTPSIGNVCKVTGMSHSSTLEVTKLHKWYLYKIKFYVNCTRTPSTRIEEIIALCD